MLSAGGLIVRSFEVLLRADLDELQSTGKSLMPEGLEKDLSKQDLADVMAYVRSREIVLPARKTGSR